MIRSAAITLAMLLIGFPACAAAMMVLVRLTGQGAPNNGFTLLIGTTSLWLVLFFAALWFGFPAASKGGNGRP